MEGVASRKKQVRLFDTGMILFISAVCAFLFLKSVLLGALLAASSIGVAAYAESLKTKVELYKRIKHFSAPYVAFKLRRDGMGNWTLKIVGAHVHTDLSPGENKLSRKHADVVSSGSSIEDAVNEIESLFKSHSVQKGDVCGEDCPHHIGS